LESFKIGFEGRLAVCTALVASVSFFNAFSNSWIRFVAGIATLISAELFVHCYVPFSWITWSCFGEVVRQEKFPYQIGHFEFSAHGESVEGPNKGSIYTHHEVSVSMKTSKPGVIYAAALCNIHGLWQSQKEIKLSK
jgi:desulfoferrodoxin (superoxide reductase-like protein)